MKTLELIIVFHVIIGLIRPQQGKVRSRYLLVLQILLEVPFDKMDKKFNGIPLRMA